MTLFKQCFHLSQLRQLKRHVSRDTLWQLVSAFILNRLDYCNSLLYGLPSSTIAPLQRMQNAAARLVLGLSPRDHVSSALQTLHWLPIHYRIQFKIALLMYNALAGRCLEYIKDIVALVASNPGRQQLRSDVIVPRCRTKFGSRAFSVAGPEVWNRLPQSVRLADTVRQFRRLLKTHYTSSCILVLTNSAVTVFNLVFTLHTFYDYCNAFRSGFVYRGALNTLIVLYCIVLYCMFLM